LKLRIQLDISVGFLGRGSAHHKASIGNGPMLYVAITTGILTL